MSNGGSKKKENHQNLTLKMMIIPNQVQLWRFSHTRALFFPQKLLKIAYRGQKGGIKQDSKNFSEVKRKGFHDAQDTNIQNQLQNKIYLIRFGHTEALLSKKKGHETALFPVLQKLPHMYCTYVAVNQSHRTLLSGLGLVFVDSAQSYCRR